MKVLVQRVREAHCRINDDITAAISHGFVLFVSFRDGETGKAIPWMAKKVANLRIFDDAEGNLNRSLKDVAGSVLSISQFTLEADARKGNRPSFTQALAPTQAHPLYDQFNHALSRHGIPVNTGQFGETMHISLTNDGPVTILLERNEDNDS